VSSATEAVVAKVTSFFSFGTAPCGDKSRQKLFPLEIATGGELSHTVDVVSASSMTFSLVSFVSDSLHLIVIS